MTFYIVPSGCFKQRTIVVLLERPLMMIKTDGKINQNIADMRRPTRLNGKAVINGPATIGKIPTKARIGRATALTGPTGKATAPTGPTGKATAPTGPTGKVTAPTRPTGKVTALTGPTGKTDLYGKFTALTEPTGKATAMNRLTTLTGQNGKMAAPPRRTTMLINLAGMVKIVNGQNGMIGSDSVKIKKNLLIFLIVYKNLNCEGDENDDVLNIYLPLFLFIFSKPQRV
jgi:hypothetical protein